MIKWKTVIEFICKHINVEFVITGKSRREERWEYPLDALREAVINAICHRDYSAAADIQIKIYDDFIRIWNPGTLPWGMTLEELHLPNHSSKPRNKLIARIFYDLGLIERYGSGIQRIIHACVGAGLPEPVFEEQFGGFAVTFQKDKVTEAFLRDLALNERQIKAILFVKEERKITNQEYQKLTDSQAMVASLDLRDLVDKGILARKGTTGRGVSF